MNSRVGKYEVLTRLAKGGMAELSLAATSGAGGFRKFVVLKQILPEAAGDENFVKMFLDEARVTAAFSHPSICQVFEMGEDAATGLYVAMEFIAGQDLNQVVAACARQQAVLPIGYSASVVHDCAQALHYAHTFKLPNGSDSPVIHRDVAQKNIMVTYDGQVKLLDFGIAKAKGALSRTRAGTVKGTAGYMSPEQVRGEAIDGRSDVFSLGVVLWEMVTGRRLFSADTELAELKMILNEPISAPADIEPSVPRELSDVVMKALERDLSQRFRSARELSKALSTTCGHLLFDAEERAEFMKERFADKIASTQRLFDASKEDTDMGPALEEFRRSSSHDRDTDELVKRKPIAQAVSASKLKPVKGVPSVNRLKKVKASKSKLEPASEVGQWDRTEAVVATTPAPRSSSVVWPVLAVIVALAVGAGVFLAMKKAMANDTPRPPKEPVTLGTIPGVDSPDDGTDPVKPDPVDPTPSPKKDPPPTTTRPAVPKEKGEMTLALIPEARVSRGGTLLGHGTFVSFSLPVGTHRLTVTGADGVRRSLSLQVGAGKNKAQKFRLEDLPPE
jgi:serine/threonine-protein kinase